ncbi:unnamed protein product [Sphagnum troendelagicum]|uniref:Uncharacterized protein n=1 Tax=Sphagnum troendelagicum TaxID=128251 RepID=A0ABP0TDK6_9BRYO
MAETTEKVLAVRHGQHLEWFGNRKQSRGLTEHHGCCFGINHWRSLDPHHLFMIDIVTATDAIEEATPNTELMGVAEDEELEVTGGERRPRKGQGKYYNRQQQLELVLAAQELSDVEGCEINLTIVGEEDKCGVEMRGSDVWQDATCMALLKEGMLPEMVELEEGKKARKQAVHYYWKEQKLFFKDLYVPRPEERRSLVV